jgi:lipopolysaccharide transport system ATP-binding protein
MEVSPALMRRKVEGVAEFSGLGDYLSLPVRTYSSGMMLRLAFAIPTSVETDIILMDEWLSVGDAAFRVRASARLQQVINRSAIMVLASHNPKLIEAHCNRAVRLEHGRITKAYERRAPN